MRPLSNQIGKTYSYLTILEELPPSCVDKRGTKIRKMLCRCICGGTKECLLISLKQGNTKSCGCMSGINRRKHGFYNTDVYTLWENIKQRCLNQNRPGWEDYGGRQIGVCESWANNPKEFCQWALSNGWKKGLKIDRIDNNKGYSPENCRFVNDEISNLNRRCTIYIEWNGVARTVKEWSEITGLSAKTIRGRFHSKNWTTEQILTTPKSKKNAGVFRIIKNKTK